MKEILLILGFVICSNYFSSAQYEPSLVVNSNGRVLFNKEKIKKTKHLKTIIDKKNDPKLNQFYQKYRNKHILHSAVSRFRDFGLFYAVLNEEFNPSIRPVPLAIGLSGTGLSLVTKKARNKRLNELVDYYNYLESTISYPFENKESLP